MRTTQDNLGGLSRSKTVLSDRAENMDAFDSLPPVIRHELRYATLDFGCCGILDGWKEWPEEHWLLSHIRESDGRVGAPRVIAPLRPVKPSIQDRRAARLAARRMRRMEAT